MKKALGKYGLANVDDTNGNGAVEIVMMTMTFALFGSDDKEM